MSTAEGGRIVVIAAVTGFFCFKGGYDNGFTNGRLQGELNAANERRFRERMDAIDKESHK